MQRCTHALTDESIRVFRQLAAAIAIGRIDAVAGRASSEFAYPLFALEVADDDTLFRTKINLLLALSNGAERARSGPPPVHPQAGSHRPVG